MMNLLKALKLVIIFSIEVLICISVLGCHPSVYLQKNDNEDSEILKIVVNAEGVVNVKGNNLVFRLFQSGKAEFDKANSELNATDKLVRNTILVNENDLVDIKKILKDLELSNHKSEYSPNIPVTDVKTVTSVIYKNSLGESSKIDLLENDSRIDFTRTKNKYPHSLVKLFEKIVQIRDVK